MTYKAIGLIPSLFVQDLVLPRKDAEAGHIIQAIGSSSLRKRKSTFVARYIPKTSPTIYGNYEEVYSDPEVDVVYIGTLTRSTRRIVWMPSLLARMCFARRLSHQTREMPKKSIMAAKAKSGSLMEAMWTRFTADANVTQKAS